jgi:SAM-dependent methyltransferase
VDYEAIFERRARQYAEACRRHPGAREQERDLLVKLLDPGPGDVVLDHPAGSGYLAEGLERAASALSIVCAEPVAGFAATIPDRFRRLRCGFERIGLGAKTVDRAGSLAGLHHLPSTRPFLRELHRVLRPGGTLVVADVELGTPVARFLNGPVDRWSETGHAGRFFPPGGLTKRLRAAGFAECEETFQRYTWDFPDWEALLSFTRLLFGLSRASRPALRRELSRRFEIREDAGGVHLPWMLVYARGRKS